MLIDTHAHLNFSAFKDDCDEIIKKTLANDCWIINVGSQSTTSERAAEMAKKYPQGVYAAVGLHPTHLFEMEIDEAEADVKFKSRREDWDADFYEKLAQNKKVVAIGEIGLDYNFAPKNMDLEIVKKRQQEVFRQALDSADKLNLPVIIHSRDTHNDIIPILKGYLDAGRLKRRGVLHCFTGNWEDAKKYLNLGFLVSFTGIITFKPRSKQAGLQKPASPTDGIKPSLRSGSVAPETSAGRQIDRQTKLLEVIKNIPLEKMMIETDAPYLAPEPFRGKRNEPLHVQYVARKIAEIKNLGFETIAAATTQTAKTFFKL